MPIIAGVIAALCPVGAFTAAVPPPVEVPVAAVDTPPPPVNPTPPPRRRVVPRTIVSPAPPPIVNRLTGTPVSADDIENFTDALIPALMQRDHVVGVTVAVVQGDTPVLIKGYGYDRLSPRHAVDGNASLFRIGSITKTFTWIVARQEIEAGRLKLDGPVAAHLPPDIFRDDRRYTRPLRMRDLMAHTGGFEDSSLGHLFRLDQGSIESTDTYFRRHAPDRVREPGAFASYSNYGAALAARAAAHTAKASDVPTLMEARIFRPLGLNATTLREPYDPALINASAAAEGLPAPMPAALAGRLSQGYSWDGATWKTQPFDYALPLAGALSGSSTAADMGRYMSLLLGDGQLNGVQLFDAGSARAFRSPLLSMPNGYNGWASGLRIGETSQGRKTYGHAGATLWFNANMILVPELGIGIFVAANTETGDVLTRAYPELLVRHLEGAATTGPRQPAQSYARNPAYFDALRGTYVSSRRAYGGLEGAVTRLINTVEVDVDNDGRLIVAAQDGASAFVTTSARGFFVPQEMNPLGPQIGFENLHFLFKPQGGKATAFETSANMARFERVGWYHTPDFLYSMTALMLGSCVMVLMGLSRIGQRDHPTDPQIMATWISYATAFVWILAIAVFQSWKTSLDGDPSALFTRWPSGQLQLASGMAVLASLATLFQLGNLYRVYEEAHYHADGWALWQKTAHTALNLGWLSYAVLLMSWGALTPWG
ncbi:serine hydrolase [Asticcacaulis sp. BYS171W]|uniref:Serine hydrolase n=1 Tax=Asticcacaulis aquaticus TaxID=2984212 RepID=A0ABT5HQS6_9CAUL|nr:serine hydrolase domain-containing protein [Asticcacaulis aquaticus]MDC7682413.1 serine hydrolase [Asticcacaulis aquaticus]